MADIKITEVVNGLETVKTEAPASKVKADADLKLTPEQVEALIKKKQAR
jgi:hypothetical protein